MLHRKISVVSYCAPVNQILSVQRLLCVLKSCEKDVLSLFLMQFPLLPDKVLLVIFQRTLSAILQVLQYQSQQSYQNKAVPSAAVLFVYVERAHGLPVRLRFKAWKCLKAASVKHLLFGVLAQEERQGAKSWSWSRFKRCFVQNKGMNVEHQNTTKFVKIKSKCFLWFIPKICERSTSPRWDEPFHFLVRDPTDETLTVKVRETEFLTKNCKKETFEAQIFHTDEKRKVSVYTSCFCPALPQLGPGSGVSDAPSERGAVWAGSGAGPLAQSGWSPAGESDTAEDYTEGELPKHFKNSSSNS